MYLTTWSNSLSGTELDHKEWADKPMRRSSGRSMANSLSDKRLASSFMHWIIAKSLVVAEKIHVALVFLWIQSFEVAVVVRRSEIKTRRDTAIIHVCIVVNRVIFEFFVLRNFVVNVAGKPMIFFDKLEEEFIVFVRVGNGLTMVSSSSPSPSSSSSASDSLHRSITTGGGFFSTAGFLFGGRLSASSR